MKRPSQSELYATFLQRTSSLNVEDIRAVYSDEMSYIDRVNGSDFYFYTAAQDAQEIETVPFVSLLYISTFYPDALTLSRRFDENQQRLLNVGQRLSQNYHIGLAEYQSAAPVMLESGYNLTTALRQIDATPGSLSRQAASVPGNIKVIFQRFIDNEVGPEKPEAVRETLRRYIPRWQTELIQPPDNLDQRWRQYTTQDVSLLVHPDHVSVGLPIHRIMQAADAQEDLETAYDMRTYAIDQLLTREEEHMQTDNPEIPFFHYIVGGAMTSHIPRAPKNAYYDIGKALDTTMAETLMLFRMELGSGAEGRGTAFLKSLLMHYPEHFELLLAASIAKYSQTSPVIDEIDMIKSLAAVNPDLSKRLTSFLMDISERRALTSSELQAIIEKRITPKQFVFDPTSFADDTLILLEDEDMINIGDSLRTGSNKLSVEIDIDQASGNIVGTFVYTSGKEVKTVPFSMDMMGDVETVSLEVLDGEIDPQLKTQYRDAIAQVIHGQAAKVREKNGALAKKQKAQPLSLTQQKRDERIAAYQARKREEQNAILELQSTHSQHTSEAVYSIKTDVPPVPQVMLLGLDEETVQSLLDDEHIEVVDANRFIRKVSYFVEAASLQSTFFGKQIIVSQYGAQYEHIDLREIKWRLDGGKTALRIIVEHMGNKLFVLRGVLNKKSEEQQTRYIEKLVKRIYQQQG